MGSLALSLMLSAVLLAAGVWRYRQWAQTESEAQMQSNDPGSDGATEGGNNVLDQLIELSQRLRTVKSTVVIRTMTAIEAASLIDVEASAFLPAVPGRRRLFCSYTSDDAPDFFVRAEVEDGALARCLDTGTPLNAVLVNDPSLLHRPTAVAAAPVTVRRHVVGALVVARQGETPFSAGDVETLGLLAAVSGAALDAASPNDPVIASSDVDELTSLSNRRRLDRDLRQAEDLDIVGFAMIDIDHLAELSARHGHLITDRAIAAISEIISITIRSSDVVYRAGGGVFAVLMPGATGGQAAGAMERVRAAVERAEVMVGEIGPFTTSIGVSAGTGSDALPERARQALVQAKSDGVNRVVLSG